MFTHDLLFVFQLDRCATRLGVEPFHQHVCRTDIAIGCCDSAPPLTARPVTEAVRYLERRASQVRALYDAARIAEYEEQARAIYGRLRETWELAVEEALAPVYRRFDHDVDTKKLRCVTVLTDEDCDTVNVARERCSRLQHRQPVQDVESPPTPDSLENDLNDLKHWIESIRQRQDALGL